MITSEHLRQNPLPGASSGNAQLDAILGGGFPTNSINIIMGEPGSGKTILAERLIFANAAKIDDPRPILYLTTLSEPLQKVVRYLQQFSFFDEDKLMSGASQYDSIVSITNIMMPTIQFLARRARHSTLVWRPSPGVSNGVPGGRMKRTSTCTSERP